MGLSLMGKTVEQNQGEDVVICFTEFEMKYQDKNLWQGRGVRRWGCFWPEPHSPMQKIFILMA